MSVDLSKSMIIKPEWNKILVVDLWLHDFKQNPWLWASDWNLKSMTKLSCVVNKQQMHTN